MNSPEKRILLDALRAFCVEAMRRCGLSNADARLTADVLVMNDAWGIFTHGTVSLRGYLRRARAGGIAVQTAPEVAREGAGWALVDGHSAMAMVTGCFAMRTAMTKAKAAGIGYVGVRNSGHFGAAGYYAYLAAEQNMIGLAMTNGDPVMTVPGAKGRVISCQAFAFAAPAGKRRPILFDAAMSAVAGGKIVEAESRGATIPEGWLVDAEGRPTTDPSWFLRGGALLPMAGHKGYGLALLVEMLAAVLTGGAIAREVKSWAEEKHLAAPTGVSHALIALDIGAMLPIEQFHERMERLCSEIVNSPKAQGAQRIYLPGELEWARRDEALAKGIPMTDRVIASLKGLARDLGMEADELFKSKA